MKENELRDLIQSWENLSLVSRHIADHPDLLGVLMSVAFDDSKLENWRAVWMVEKVYDQHPDLIRPYFPAMTEFLFTTSNNSKKRHLLKLISLNPIQEDQMGKLLNYGIETFIDASMPVAVRVHALQILFNISLKEPDFAGELIELIEHELAYHDSAGIRSRGKHLLRKLYQLRKKS